MEDRTYSHQEKLQRLMIYLSLGYSAERAAYICGVTVGFAKSYKERHP